MSAAIGWSRRMHPSTNDRLPLLDPVSSLAPHSPRSPFKTYQGTAHAVPASAVAAHSARSRADAEQHGLLSILGSTDRRSSFRWLAHLFVHTCPGSHLWGFGGGGHAFAVAETQSPANSASHALAHGVLTRARKRAGCSLYD